MYDDGNYRASPFATSVADSANQSRAVEYTINEQTMEVSQVWEYGGSITQALFTPSVGGVEWLEKSGNVLVTFGNITYAGGMPPSPYSTNAAMVREAIGAATPTGSGNFDFVDQTVAGAGARYYRVVTQ